MRPWRPWQLAAAGFLLWLVVGWLFDGRPTERGDGLAAVRVAAPERCLLRDEMMRMHRLHMVFNDRGRQVATVENPSATQNLALAMMLHLADARLGAPARWSRAEMWDDMNFGTQYLLDGTVDGRPVFAAISDDRRHQPAIIVDDAPYSGRITVIMALYNRGTQLAAWAAALAAMRDTDKRAARLCVADFSSTDADVRAHLEGTGFAFTLLVLDGAFAKTEALNACLRTVTDANEVVFTTDVDVMLPVDFFDRVRRYVRPGRRVYAPVVWYDECEWNGASGQTVCWGDGGYGLVGYARGDALAVGDYDASRFNVREGFEDTDFLLRLLRLPRLLVRKRERDMVHLPHPRSPWKSARNRGEYADIDFPPVC